MTATIAQYFSPGKQVVWRGEVFEIDRLLPNKQIQLQNVRTQGIQTPTLDEVYNELYAGHLEFVLEGRGVKKPKEGEPATDPKYLELDKCPLELKAEAEFRLKAIKPLLDMGCRTRQDVIGRVQEVKAQPEYAGEPISVASVYRWIGDYEGSGRDQRSLISDEDERGGAGQWRMDATAEKFMTEAIDEAYEATTERREAKTVDDILHAIRKKIDAENEKRSASDKLAYPSRTTVQRRIDALDIRAKFAAHHGKRAADEQFAQYGKGPEAERPGERNEIDHTKTDFIVIDDEDNLPLGRLTYTHNHDARTRYPVGIYLGFEPPSYYAVMECLYHSILPKTGLKEKFGLEHDWIAHGLPATLVSDNGREFIGKDLEAACRDLNMVLEQMPVKKARYKGKVERMLRSVAFFLHGLPGTTFSNPRERAQYDSTGMACLYLSDAFQIMVHFLVDIYAERFNKGLGGVPARRWEAFLETGFMPRVPASADKLLILLGKTERRTVQPYGVDFECLRYNSPDLGYLRNQLGKAKTDIKIHPGDLSQIHVLDPFSGTYLAVPAEDSIGYTQGLSLWKHRVIHRRVLEQQDKMDLAALGRARDAIQAIVDAAQGRKQTARAALARWKHGANPPSLGGKAPAPAPLLPPPPPGLPTPEATAVSLPTLQLSDEATFAYEYTLPTGRRA